MSVVRYNHDDTHERSWVGLMAPAVELAKAVADTEFVPKHLRGNPAAITAAILYGDEVGLPPMQALGKIAVIDGKPTLAAEAQRALILAAGHDLWVEEATTSRVTVAGRRRGSDKTQLVTWTLDDAKRAGLAGKPNWRTYPRPMLLARASAELARAAFADVIGGLAATEEIEDGDNPDTPIEDDAQTPPKPSSRRKRADRPATPAVIAPAPPAAAQADDVPLPDDPPEPEPTITDAQMKLLQVKFKERGVTGHDDRLDWANQHLDRTIVSSKELTVAEASRLIDRLDQEIDAMDAYRDHVADPPPEPIPGQQALSE